MKNDWNSQSSEKLEINDKSLFELIITMLIVTRNHNEDVIYVFKIFNFILNIDLKI